MDEITHHTMLHETTKKFMEGFRYDAHPMAMLVSTVAALSSVYPDEALHDPAKRLLQIKRLIGKMPSIAAMSYRHSLGFPYVYPDNDLSYTENFMNMLWRMVEPKYAANPVLARALDILFILHADHEQNCSTSTMRAVGSSHSPYLALSRPRRRFPARCTAAPTKKSSACSTKSAPTPTFPPTFRELKKARQADGLWPPCLQELRSSGQDHQMDCPGCSKSRDAIPSWISRWNWSASRSKTIISFSGSSIRTWISTPESSIKPWDSRLTSLRCYSPSHARWAGWRSGRRCYRQRAKDRAAAAALDRPRHAGICAD